MSRPARLEPATFRLKKRHIVLGLLVGWGAYYFWPSGQQSQTPVPAPQPIPPQMTTEEVCDNAPSSGDPLSFSGTELSGQPRTRIAILMVNHGGRTVKCTADLAGLERVLPVAVRAELQARPGSTMRGHRAATVEQFRKALAALKQAPSVPVPVAVPVQPVQPAEEICAAVSTSGDRAEYTGRIIDRPNGVRLAVFHVRHGSREVTCAVDRIGVEELPKAMAAARNAPGGSELRANLSHTVEELRKAQAALTPSTPPPQPEPSQPGPPSQAGPPSQPEQQWSSGLVTGLSADGWPLMNNKEFAIYGLNPIPEGPGRTNFLEWLVKSHGRYLECREHQQSGAYDCRVTAGNDTHRHVDVANTLILNGATTRK